jgi:hypothetical protein
MNFIGYAKFSKFDKYYYIIPQMKHEIFFKKWVEFIFKILINLSILKKIHQHHQYSINDELLNSSMPRVPTPHMELFFTTIVWELFKILGMLYISKLYGI